MCGRADYDRRFEFLRERFEPGGEIYRISDHRIFQPIGRSDVARGDHSRVDANTDLDGRLAGGLGSVPVVQAFEHFHGATHRPASISARAFAQRRPENDHDAVADEFIQETAVVLDDLAHRGQVPVEPCQHLLGRNTRGHRCETPDIREQNSCHPLFSGKHDRVAILPDFSGHVGRHVAFEQSHRLVALRFHPALQVPLVNRSVAQASRQCG